MSDTENPAWTTWVVGAPRVLPPAEDIAGIRWLVRKFPWVEEAHLALVFRPEAPKAPTFALFLVPHVGTNEDEAFPDLVAAITGALMLCQCTFVQMIERGTSVLCDLRSHGIELVGPLDAEDRPTDELPGC